MRRLLAILAIFTIALPAAAADCVEGSITWKGTNPLWGPGDAVEGIRTDIVGTFLWVQYGESVDELDGTVSVEIPTDAVGASVCGDGTVTFGYAIHLDPPSPDPEVAHNDPIDLVAMWAAWIDLTPRLMVGPW